MRRDKLEALINLRSVISRLGNTGLVKGPRTYLEDVVTFTQEHMMLYPEVVIDLRDSVVIQSLSRTQAVVS